MIQSITVTNHLDDELKIEMRFPEKSGFLIKDISGLNPSKANINVTEMSTTDGSVYNSSRINTRNIVISLRLVGNDDLTLEDTRSLSYRYFPIKKRVRLEIEMDSRTCEIYGNVESNEINIFGEEQVSQISLICTDPYFYSKIRTITKFAGVDSLFEFPFENNSLTTPLLNMGEVVVNKERTILYEGDSEIGIMIYIHALGDATNVTIYNSRTREVMKIDTAKLQVLTGNIIKAGDDITISTLKGDKYITLLRNGVYTNILNCLDKGTDWFTLAQGDNLFVFTADTGSINLQFRIENQTIYQGV